MTKKELAEMYLEDTAWMAEVLEECYPKYYGCSTIALMDDNAKKVSQLLRDIG